MISSLPTRSLVAAAAALTLMAGACGSDDDGAPAGEVVEVGDPWVRQPVEGQTTSAMYATLTNGGDETITAVGASASVSDMVELHEVVMNDDGTMTMREKDGGYVIEPGESITLEPGGLHVMMMGVDPADFPDEVDVTLEFDDGSEASVTAPVRDATAGAMDMGDDEMEDMGDG